MNYTLVNADCRTHFKIVAVAILASILLGLAQRNLPFFLNVAAGYDFG